ncbi:FAD-dependent oxidoreductase [Pseudorhizobium flavum]|uniref:Thioredoxin reductase n=1 Tax=Pseudorhizobium flavum TaxID=1335061 RepID=A0A7W9YXI4_9HYPH|nr:FAD-dependent oxidoreductase [Pseudorhizobium flavum]MBB6179819.1 thioredoxin reductase [Pseudorhizobium flavum]CAD6596986.1 oxidase [Pseudorhizobium flavum]
MVEPDVIVVGGGPAGLAAATEVAASGYLVELVEQRNSVGGAVHRQPVDRVAHVPQARGTRASWERVSRAFSEAQIPVRYQSVFFGVDGDGFTLIENRQTGQVELLRPKAIIIATGAVEKVLPRPGWQLPGVSTAGGLQVMMKETGQAPQGRVLLAGTGPLLVAVAAQMAKLGNPPVAIVEAGDPLRRFRAGLKLLSDPTILVEAAGYLASVARRRITWLRGARIVAIEDSGTLLEVRVRDSGGSERSFTVDRIGLHDGIRPNDFGLPEDSTGPRTGPFIFRAGDCREALGAYAAETDGRRVGRMVSELLLGNLGAGDLTTALERSRRTQANLAALFAPVRPASPFCDLPDEIVLCRCESKTVGDLRSLCSQPDRLTGREVKHNGRFAMGACQGRFCAENTASLMAQLNPGEPQPLAEDLTGRRWPVRPVSIAALTRANPTRTESQ